MPPIGADRNATAADTRPGAPRGSAHGSADPVERDAMAPGMAPGRAQGWTAGNRIGIRCDCDWYGRDVRCILGGQAGHGDRNPVLPKFPIPSKNHRQSRAPIARQRGGADRAVGDASKKDRASAAITSPAVHRSACPTR